MTYLSSIADVFVVLLFLASIRAVRDYRRRRGLPYPPGPRPLPIIGNILDIPKEFSWLAYSKFSKTYGDILSFHLFGQVVVVLNTAKATKDLLDKRSAIYSDRPTTPIYEMMGWSWVLALRKSDERWRLGRRMLDRSLRPAATASYLPMIQARTGVFLSRMLENPHLWEGHLDLLQGEMILATTYGYQVNGPDDKLLVASKKRSKYGTEKILPGTLLVNQIPLLRHIPEWLPWFTYKPLIRIGQELGNQVVHPPMRFVKESMLNGTARPSLALEHLREQEDQKLNGPDRNKVEEAMAGALASMYAAGLDTTVAAFKWFLVAMLLSPDIQKKAQDELDSVIGRDRLPNFEDRSRLPYVDAVCKEVLRWHPALPAGLPHMATQDDIYEGFFIPQGAVMISNVWTIFHDPALYPEPDLFKPERYLNPNGTLREDPVLTSLFGFGKRICPGRHFADASLFISIASLLSVFDIKRGRGGGDKRSDYTYAGFSIVSVPNPFPCSFVPRDKRARELILADAMMSW